MDYTHSALPAPSHVTSVKILVAGGFGVGKTTLVGAVSEISPLTTDAVMTAANDLDMTAPVPGKSNTTVAMDFGRITVAKDLVVYLFGTPGQSRFWPMWDELRRGAIGAIVLVDTRRVADCFASIDFFEDRKVPYLVAVNRFDGAPHYGEEELRDALTIAAQVPLVRCDARQRASVKKTLVSLVEHVTADFHRARAAMTARRSAHLTPADPLTWRPRISH